MSDFTLDTDFNIPTGVPATPEQVADMVADPDSPVTLDTIPELVEWQQPSEDQLADAANPV